MTLKILTQGCEICTRNSSYAGLPTSKFRVSSSSGSRNSSGHYMSPPGCVIIRPLPMRVSRLIWHWIHCSLENEYFIHASDKTVAPQGTHVQLMCRSLSWLSFWTLLILTVCSLYRLECLSSFSFFDSQFRTLFLSDVLVSTSDVILLRHPRVAGFLVPVFGSGFTISGGMLTPDIPRISQTDTQLKSCLCGDHDGVAQSGALAPLVSVPATSMIRRRLGHFLVRECLNMPLGYRGRRGREWFEELQFIASIQFIAIISSRIWISIIYCHFQAEKQQP